MLIWKLECEYVPLKRNTEYSWKDVYVAHISRKPGCWTCPSPAPIWLFHGCDTNWFRNFRINPNISVMTFMTGFAFLFNKHLWEIKRSCTCIFWRFMCLSRMLLPWFLQTMQLTILIKVRILKGQMKFYHVCAYREAHTCIWKLTNLSIHLLRYSAWHWYRSSSVSTLCSSSSWNSRHVTSMIWLAMYPCITFTKCCISCLWQNKANWWMLINF